MKNQKMGVVVLRPYHPNARPPMATDYRLLEKAQGDYVKHRKNGDACLILPRDGKCTWTKGRVAGDYVYGVKESDGYYHYELRYDEGPEDKAMMEKDDWEYIQNLLREGRLLEVEPNADKEIAWRHRYRKQIKRALKAARAGCRSIGEWEVKRLANPSFWNRLFGHKKEVEEKATAAMPPRKPAAERLTEEEQRRQETAKKEREAAERAAKEAEDLKQKQLEESRKQAEKLDLERKRAEEARLALERAQKETEEKARIEKLDFTLTAQEKKSDQCSEELAKQLVAVEKNLANLEARSSALQAKISSRDILLLPVAKRTLLFEELVHLQEQAIIYQQQAYIKASPILNRYYFAFQHCMTRFYIGAQTVASELTVLSDRIHGVASIPVKVVSRIIERIPLIGDIFALTKDTAISIDNFRRLLKLKHFTNIAETPTSASERFEETGRILALAKEPELAALPESTSLMTKAKDKVSGEDYTEPVEKQAKEDATLLMTKFVEAVEVKKLPTQLVELLLDPATIQAVTKKSYTAKLCSDTAAGPVPIPSASEGSVPVTLSITDLASATRVTELEAQLKRMEEKQQRDREGQEKLQAKIDALEKLTEHSVPDTTTDVEVRSVDGRLVQVQVKEEKRKAAAIDFFRANTLDSRVDRSERDIAKIRQQLSMVTVVTYELAEQSGITVPDSSPAAKSKVEEICAPLESPQQNIT